MKYNIEINTFNVFECVNMTPEYVSYKSDYFDEFVHSLSGFDENKTDLTAKLNL